MYDADGEMVMELKSYRGNPFSWWRIGLSVLVVFAGLYYYYHAQEKRWISESEEITFKSEYQRVMTIEYRTAQQMRKELLERLDLIR